MERNVVASSRGRDPRFIVKMNNGLTVASVDVMTSLRMRLPSLRDSMW